MLDAFQGKKYEPLTWAVVTGGIDAASMEEAVKFTGDEQVIVVIPVGHPAK